MRQKDGAFASFSQKNVPKALSFWHIISEKRLRVEKPAGAFPGNMRGYTPIVLFFSYLVMRPL